MNLSAAWRSPNETHGFASPPHDGFAFIEEPTEGSTVRRFVRVLLTPRNGARTDPLRNERLHPRCASCLGNNCAGASCIVPVATTCTRHNQYNRSKRGSELESPSATWQSHQVCETHGFASPPHDGFAFIEALKEGPLDLNHYRNPRSRFPARQTLSGVQQNLCAKRSEAFFRPDLLILLRGPWCILPEPHSCLSTEELVAN